MKIGSAQIRRSQPAKFRENRSLHLGQVEGYNIKLGQVHTEVSMYKEMKIVAGFPWESVTGNVRQR